MEYKRQPSAQLRQSYSAAEPSRQSEPAATQEACRPAITALQQVTALADQSPRVVAQAKLFRAIESSPRMVAQAQALRNSLGATLPSHSVHRAQGTPGQSMPPAQRQDDGTGEQSGQVLESADRSADRQDAAIGQQVSGGTNRTGIPDQLKNGIESLSGMSLDAVRVHYNSARPMQLNALAYAQGTDIHIGPGQQQHLPHEAWHVVQQAQGRVKPTIHMQDGVPVNDDAALEQEADVMGQNAMQLAVDGAGNPPMDRPGQVLRNIPGQAIQRHVLIGAMIKGQDNPAPADAGQLQDFSHDKVFDKSSHRGDLADAETGGGFDWDFGALNDKVEEIRAGSGYKVSDPNFYVVANVNTYKTPGMDDIPKSARGAHLYAFGNGWSLNYNLNPFKKGRYSDDYDAVLSSWAKLPKNPSKKLSSTNEALGAGSAAKVLRYLTKKYWLANKNFVIPHRGLRNSVLEKIHEIGIIGKLQQEGGTHVSILHLDDDLQVGDKSMVTNMMKQGEIKSGDTRGRENAERGVAFSAPGYIYEMEDNLLEYTASVLSHVAGRVVKDSYPSEPGLMVTYKKSHEKSVWRDFLLKSPWGDENPDMNELPSYGKKQSRARVESKEGRAFAQKYSEYLVSLSSYATDPRAASYKVPVRGKEFVSVTMSSVVRKEIIGKTLPGDVSKLSEKKVLEWIQRYVLKNRYHPAGGNSESANAFRNKVIPWVATAVKKILSEGGNQEDMQAKIRVTLESVADETYQKIMGSKDEEVHSPMKLASLEDIRDDDEDEGDEDEDSMSFADWMGEIKQMLWERRRLRIRDLPDEPFMDCFEDRMTPEEFYEQHFDDTLSFEDWMEEVADMAWNEYEMDLDDLPDQPFMISYEDGMSPEEFYEEYMSDYKAF